MLGVATRGGRTPGMTENDTPQGLDSAMATGSDAGEAGNRHDPTAPAPGGAVEDSAAAVSAADDDSPLAALAPDTGGDEDPAGDGVTPLFREP